MVRAVTVTQLSKKNGGKTVSQYIVMVRPLFVISITINIYAEDQFYNLSSNEVRRLWKMLIKTECNDFQLS